MHQLQSEIERLYAMGPNAAKDPSASETFVRFRDALSAGKIRAAEKVGGAWLTNAWVKQGILLGFRIGKLAESGDPRVLSFVDKDTYPTRHFAATRTGARHPWRLVGAQRSLCRVVRRLHASHVHQRRRLR